VIVSHPRARTTYSIALRKILFQAEPTSELRVDEPGKPFLWVTTVKPISETVRASLLSRLAEGASVGPPGPTAAKPRDIGEPGRLPRCPRGPRDADAIVGQQLLVGDRGLLHGGIIPETENH
jgi:hypothetical protein